MVVYINPLIDESATRTARSGFGYDVPVEILAMVIYQAETCIRIGYKDLWVFLDNDTLYIKITNEKHLDVLEQWYQDKIKKDSENAPNPRVHGLIKSIREQGISI